MALAYVVPVKLMLEEVAVTVAVPVAPALVDPKLFKLIVPDVAVKLCNATIVPTPLSNVSVPVVPVCNVKLRVETSGLIVPVTWIVPPPTPDPVERDVLVAIIVTFPVSVMSFAVVVIFPPSMIAPVSWTAPVDVIELFCKILAPVRVKQPKFVEAPIGPSS